MKWRKTYRLPISNFQLPIAHCFVPYEPNRQSAIENRQSSLVVILDFRNGRKRYLNYLARRGQHLHARRRKCLGSFHTADLATHALPVSRYDLHVVFAIKRLQSRQCFGNFQVPTPYTLPRTKAKIQGPVGRDSALNSMRSPFVGLTGGVIV